jgi:hypothetical protein
MLIARRLRDAPAALRFEHGAPLPRARCAGGVRRLRGAKMLYYAMPPRAKRAADGAAAAVYAFICQLLPLRRHAPRYVAVLPARSRQASRRKMRVVRDLMPASTRACLMPFMPRAASA